MKTFLSTKNPVEKTKNNYQHVSANHWDQRLEHRTIETNRPIGTQAQTRTGCSL